jgi:hypothetical protein
MQKERNQQLAMKPNSAQAPVPLESEENGTRQREGFARPHRFQGRVREGPK